jgi:hypothetical protein
VMTVEPGSTLSVTNRCSEAAEASARRRCQIVCVQDRRSVDRSTQ